MPVPITITQREGKNKVKGIKKIWQMP